MRQTPGAVNRHSRMHESLDAHLQGRFSRKKLFAFLKWQMAVAEDTVVIAFLAEVQERQDLDAGLVNEVERIYEDNVRHWVFPEEPELSKALPNAIECTFPELIQTTNLAAGGLRHALNMLCGLKTRLNLRSSYDAIGKALQLVVEELELLEQSCEHVGAGTPLATAFPDRDCDERASWASPDGAPLSPKQILWLADLGKVNSEFALKYADGISYHSTPPQLVSERIRVRERQLIRAEEDRDHQELNRKAIARSCPRCNSAPGVLCKSKAGKYTTTHQGRFTIAS